MKKFSINFQRMFQAFSIFAFFIRFFTISIGMSMSFQEDRIFFFFFHVVQNSTLKREMYHPNTVLEQSSEFFR